MLKLHGKVEHPAEIVLTRDDYLAYGERRAALAGLVQGLLITKHMLFLGFSLTDDNFHRIVHDVRKAVRRGGDAPSRIGTAILLDDDLRRELWESDLELLSTRAPLGDDDPAGRGRPDPRDLPRPAALRHRRSRIAPPESGVRRTAR